MPVRLVGLVMAYLAVGYAVTLFLFVAMEAICRCRGRWDLRGDAASDWPLMVVVTLLWPPCIALAAIASAFMALYWVLLHVRLAHWLYEIPFGWIDRLHNGREDDNDAD